MYPSSSSPFNGIFGLWLFRCLMVTWQLLWLESLLPAALMNYFLICAWHYSVTLHGITAQLTGKVGTDFQVGVGGRVTTGHWRARMSNRIWNESSCSQLQGRNSRHVHLWVFVSHQSLLSTVKLLQKVCRMFTVLKLLFNLFKVSMVVPLKVKDLN